MLENSIIRNDIRAYRYNETFSLYSNITFRTSSSVADTPGFVGMMSFDPRTVDKFGVLFKLSSFIVFSEDGFVILFWDEEITELDCSVVDAP